MRFKMVFYNIYMYDNLVDYMMLINLYSLTFIRSSEDQIFYLNRILKIDEIKIWLYFLADYT